MLRIFSKHLVSFRNPIFGFMMYYTSVHYEQLNDSVSGGLGTILGRFLPPNYWLQFTTNDGGKGMAVATLLYAALKNVELDDR